MKIASQQWLRYIFHKDGFSKLDSRNEMVNFSVVEGCPILSTTLHWKSFAFHWKTGSPLVKSTPRVGVTLDMNRFHQICGVSVS